MSGTEKAHRAIFLCARSATPATALECVTRGTEIAYGATCVLCAVRYWDTRYGMVLRVCYAVCCTDIAYGATCVHCAVRYWDSVHCKLKCQKPLYWYTLDCEC
eukprot:2963511-Rhodomonas_salina.1